MDAIQYLKLFDMSLEEIKAQFESRTVETTLELYEKQLVKLRQNMEGLKNIEKRIIHNIENLRASHEKRLHTDPEIVKLEERYAVILSDTVSNDKDYEVAIRKLSHSLYENKFQLMGDFIGLKDKADLYNGEFHKTKNIGNLCISKPDYGSFKTIPSGTFVRLCYIGVTERVQEAYEQIMAYIGKRQLTITGEILEIYTVDCIDTKEPEEYVTVIEVPVE